MFCPVTVQPKAYRDLQLLIRHASSPRDAVDIRQCFDALRGLLQFDPAKLGTCIRPKPNRRIYIHGPISVLHDLVNRNGRWEVDIVGVGSNINWVR